MAGDKLPLFKLIIDTDAKSDIGVSYVALVDKPAIEKNFVVFNKKKLAFTIDIQKKEIFGAAMLADFPIFRRDEEIGDHYVQFDKETIYDISQKFFDNGYNKNFNIGHNPKDKVEGVNIYQSFIVDSSRGILPPVGFEDVKDGSWFIGAKVSNDDVMQMVQDEEIKGFSVEGFFKYKKSQELTEQLAEEVFKKIELLINSNDYTEQGKYKEIKKMLDPLEI